MVVALLAAVADCLDQPSIEERVTQRIVVTKTNPAAQFASFTTFAITDTVTVVNVQDAGLTQLSTLDPSVAEPMLREITALLTSRGYVHVARTESPDLGVAVTLLNRLNFQASAYGTWWNVGSAAPSFWGFSTAVVVAPFSYQTAAWQSGTLIMELDDLREVRREVAGEVPSPPPAQAPAVAEVRIAWTGIIHGVLGAEGATLEAPPIASIQQAFAQSPYLHR
jgi:hypothetical protein